MAEGGERAASAIESGPGSVGADKDLLIRGTLTRILAYGAMTLLGVGSTAVVTRHLGVGRFGQFATVISVTTLVATVTDSGMTAVANREYALLSGARREQMLSSLFGLRMFLTLIGTALAIAFAFAADYDVALILGMLVASLATFPLIVIHTLSIPLTNDLRLGTLALIELGRQALWVVGLVVLSLLGLGVFPLLVTTLVANLLIVPATVYVTRGSTGGLLRMRLTGWRALVGATLAFSVASATGTAYLYGTQLVTTLATSRYQAGLFAVSFRVFIVICAVPTLVGSGTIPVLARAGRDDPNQLAYVLRRYLETSIVGGVGLALALSAGAGLIIDIVAGGKFHAAVPVVAIQSFALISTFITAPCSYGLLSLHLYRQLLLANASALVVMVVVTAVLAHSHGAEGAAVASICGETTVAAIMLAGMVRARRECRPPSAFVLKVLLAALCALPLAVTGWLPSVPRIVAVVVIYAAVVLATRALPSEILHSLPFARRGALPDA